MAEPISAQPIDNNNCPIHDTYNVACGTCNGHFAPKPAQPPSSEELANKLAEHIEVETEKLKSASSEVNKTLDEIFAPIQAEYDGGEPMLPGTIPLAKQAIQELIEAEKLFIWEELEHCVNAEWEGGMKIDRDWILRKIALAKHELNSKERCAWCPNPATHTETYQGKKIRVCFAHSRAIRQKIT